MPTTKEKKRDSYTAQFAIREGRPVGEEPLDAEFQQRFETQTDYEWKRIFPAPQSPEALAAYREGNQAVREDRMMEAIEAYKKCLAIEDYAPAKSNLALAYLHEASREGWQECGRLLENLIQQFAADRTPETDSVLGPAYRNLAELLTQQGVEEIEAAKLQKAAELTRKALEIDPGNTAWRLELWGILHLLDRAEESNATLKEAGKNNDFEILSGHAKEKYTALHVKYRGGRI